MVKKAYFKAALRMFRRHLTRFFTLAAIIVVSVGFMAGIGEVRNKIEFALSDYYVAQNVSDFIIKSTNQTGFSADDLQWAASKFGAENVSAGFCFDTKIDEDVVRIYNLDLDNQNINKLRLIEGHLPTALNEVVVERKTNAIKSKELDEEVSFMGMNFEVVGIVENPLLLHKVEEISFLEGETLDNVFYFSNAPFFPIQNDIYVTLENRGLFDSFDKKYNNEIDRLKQEITLENVTILTLNENMGIYSLYSYAEKVGKIAIIFVLFFLLVAALVVFSTMTRLLDEERSQIACLKTLGYGSFSIVGKYLIFITVATLIGGIVALGVGIGLTNLLYIAFGMQYSMPPMPASMPYLYYLMTLAIMLVSSLLVTLLTGMKIAKQKPAKLLTPKAPKAGKKVIAEKIPSIWNHLSFKYKSSIRNVLLFQSRFWMTVISIIGSTVLVLAGMGLLDCGLKVENADSIIMIAVALIAFAGLLCALVIYNIANINISERNREIATLMVLGYTDREVTFYIFREIYITSSIGAVFGVPIGYGFLEFVFGFINFGATADINWWTWILAPVVTMLFTFLATMLLRKKIVKTNMNESLKTVD